MTGAPACPGCGREYGPSGQCPCGAAERARAWDERPLTPRSAVSLARQRLREVLAQLPPLPPRPRPVVEVVAEKTPEPPPSAPPPPKPKRKPHYAIETHPAGTWAHPVSPDKAVPVLSPMRVTSIPRGWYERYGRRIPGPDDEPKVAPSRKVTARDRALHHTLVTVAEGQHQRQLQEQAARHLARRLRDTYFREPDDEPEEWPEPPRRNQLSEKIGQLSPLKTNQLKLAEVSPEIISA